MKRTTLCLIAIFATIIFLTTSFETVYASYVNSEQDDLPGFLQRLAEYLSRGNASELERYKKEIAQQEKVKQDLIKSTDGTILHSSSLGSHEKGLRDGCVWPEQFIEDSPPMYWGGVLIGHIEDAENIGGSGTDGNSALLEATGWYEYPEDHFVSGEALSSWVLNEEVENDVSWSHFYAYAKKGPLTGSPPPPPWAIWKNYVIIQVADNPTSMWDWHYVGYAQAYDSEITEYYVGSKEYWFYNQIAIFAFCPYDWTPTEKTSVYVDNARIYIED
jgi:hypothetical protein